MTLLLLLAVLALGLALRRQAKRVDALEERLEALRTPAPAVAEEPPPPPATPTRPLLDWSIPARPAAPLPAPEPAAPEPARAAMFEQLVGGRLPIWVGGAALAVAGYFLVGLAIESGLLTPAVRVLLATLFGFVLLALAEAAARVPRIADDPRVHQALAGAGLATLYAAAYLAGPHYGLIGPVAAFAMMAAITALALLLSLRRGAATALMGLVGGFATPLLAGASGEAVLPLLFYLGLLSAGLFGLAVARGWLWLALITAAGSLLWSGLLIASAKASDALAAGTFALLLAVAASLVLATRDEARPRLRLLPLVGGAIELAMLIASSGFDGGAWCLYLLLSAASVVLAWRDPRLTPAVAAALVLAVAALAGAALNAPRSVLLPAIGLAMLFGGSGHAFARGCEDGRWWAAIGAAGLIVPFLILRLAGQPPLVPAGWSGLALLLALPPLHLAWRSRGGTRSAPPFDAVLVIGAGTAASFLAYALAELLPTAMLPVAILVAAVALAEGAHRLDDGGLRRLAIAAAGIALLAMLARADGLIEAMSGSLVGRRLLLPLLPVPRDALFGALLPVPFIAAVVWRAALPGTRARRLLLAAAGIAAAAGLYVLWKQVFAIRDAAGFVASGLLERALLTQAVFAAGWAGRGRGWRLAARLLTASAALRLLWLDLAVFNPAFVEQAVGPWPIANLLGLHFAAACLWLGLAWRAEPEGRGRQLALAALVVVAAGGTLLLVRQAFHGSMLVAGPLGRAEFYGYSAGGVLLSIALFGIGASLHDRPMRVAGLGLLTLMVLKVFLVDAAALGGLLRIASFLGLGLTLIAIGWAYGRLLGRDAPPVTG